jgi:predicted GNAT family acetyltransferase
MRVYQVTKEQEARKAYPCATEVPLPFWADGLPLSRAWFAENLGQNINGFHLEDDTGQVIGHIYWASSEKALAPYQIEDGVAYIYCEWVQRQHRMQGGIQNLFQAFVDFLREEGYKGVLLDGTNIEGYMHYNHFIKRGFQVVRENDGEKLLYLPLSQLSVSVKPLAPQVTREGVGEVEVLIIGCHFCPVGASAVLAVRRVVQEYGDRVILKEVPASIETIAKYGIGDGIFINGKAKFFGPVNDIYIRKAIEEEFNAKGTSKVNI